MPRRVGQTGTAAQGIVQFPFLQGFKHHTFENSRIYQLALPAAIKCLKSGNIVLLFPPHPHFPFPAPGPRAAVAQAGPPRGPNLNLPKSTPKPLPGRGRRVGSSDGMELDPSFARGSCRKRGQGSPGILLSLWRLKSRNCL